MCIIGSPRGAGSTAPLVDRLIAGMHASGISVARYVLGELQINYCRGCRTCGAEQTCVQRDDMDHLLRGILEVDVVLLASPSYWGDVTGQTKVFDRSLPLCNAGTGETPVPPRKIGVAVAVRAGRSQAENQRLVDTFAHYFGHLGIRMAASLTVEGVNTLEDMQGQQAKLEEAHQLGWSMSRLCAENVSE